MPQMPNLAIPDVAGQYANLGRQVSGAFKTAAGTVRDMGAYFQQQDVKQALIQQIKAKYPKIGATVSDAELLNMDNADLAKRLQAANQVDVYAEQIRKMYPDFKAPIDEYKVQAFNTPEIVGEIGKTWMAIAGEQTKQQKTDAETEKLTGLQNVMAQGPAAKPAPIPMAGVELNQSEAQGAPSLVNVPDMFNGAAAGDQSKMSPSTIIPAGQDAANEAAAAKQPITRENVQKAVGMAGIRPSLVNERDYEAFLGGYPRQSDLDLANYRKLKSEQDRDRARAAIARAAQSNIYKDLMLGMTAMNINLTQQARMQDRVEKAKVGQRQALVDAEKAKSNMEPELAAQYIELANVFKQVIDSPEDNSVAMQDFTAGLVSILKDKYPDVAKHDRELKTEAEINEWLNTKVPGLTWATVQSDPKYAEQKKAILEKIKPIKKRFLKK